GSGQGVEESPHPDSGRAEIPCRDLAGGKEVVGVGVYLLPVGGGPNIVHSEVGQRQLDRLGKEVAVSVRDFHVDGDDWSVEVHGSLPLNRVPNSVEKS